MLHCILHHFSFGPTPQVHNDKSKFTFKNSSQNDPKCEHVHPRVWDERNQFYALDQTFLQTSIKSLPKPRISSPNLRFFPSVFENFIERENAAPSVLRVPYPFIKFPFKT